MGNAFGKRPKENAKEDCGSESSLVEDPDLSNEWEVEGIPLEDWLSTNYQLTGPEVKSCAKFLVCEQHRADAASAASPKVSRVPDGTSALQRAPTNLGREPSRGSKSPPRTTQSQPLPATGGATSFEPHGMSLRRTISGESTGDETLSCWSMEDTKFFVCTWNVGGIADSGGLPNLPKDKRNILFANLREVISRGCGAEMLIFGLQEVADLSSTKTWWRQPRSYRDRIRKQIDTNVEAYLQIILKAANEAMSLKESNDKFLLYQAPVYMVGCLIVALIRGGSGEIGRKLSQFSTSDVAVDRFNIGTKGAVSIRFVLHDQSFAFINVHLAAKKGPKENVEKRLEQLQVILKKMHFPLTRGGQDEWVHLDAHHTIFLLGDTNFRLQGVSWDSFAVNASGRPKSQWTKSDHTEGVSGSDPYASQGTVDSADTKRLRQTNFRASRAARGSMFKGIMPFRSINLRVTSLFEKDELYNELRKPKVLVPYKGCRWKEADVSFAPTFKLRVGLLNPAGPVTDIYNPKRTPAWTDRIIYRTKSADSVTVNAYNSSRQREINLFQITDHDPVYSDLRVKVRRADIHALSSLVERWQAARGPSSDTGAEPVRQRRKSVPTWSQVGMAVDPEQLLEMYMNAWISYLSGRPEFTERQYFVLKADIRMRKVDETRVADARRKAMVLWGLNYLRPVMDVLVANPSKPSALAQFRRRISTLEDRFCGGDMRALSDSQTHRELDAGARSGVPHQSRDLYDSPVQFPPRVGGHDSDSPNNPRGSMQDVGRETKSADSRVSFRLNDPLPDDGSRGSWSPSRGVISAYCHVDDLGSVTIDNSFFGVPDMVRTSVRSSVARSSARGSSSSTDIHATRHDANGRNFRKSETRASLWGRESSCRSVFAEALAV